MSEIKIGENGNWYIDGVDTGKSSRGRDGLSAYEVAVSLGYQGTLADWPDTLKGEPGESAYEIARGLGYQGTMADWINSLKGAEGLTPQVGENGNWFIGDSNTGILADAEKAVEKKIVASTEIRDEGRLMDGKTVSEALTEINRRFQAGVSSVIKFEQGVQELEISLKEPFSDTNYGVVATLSTSPQFTSISLQNAYNKKDKFIVRVYNCYCSAVHGVINWYAFKI